MIAKEDTFTVPPRIAEFADLEDDDGALFDEYGIPNRVFFGSPNIWRWPTWAFCNVMHRIWSCGMGRQDSDERTRSNCFLALRYVRDQLCNCNARNLRGKTRNWHGPRCEFIRIAQWNYEESPQR